MEADVLFLHSFPFLLLFFIKIPHWDKMKVKPNSLCIRASTFFKLQERDEFPLLFHLDMYFALITIPAWSHFAEEIVLKKPFRESWSEKFKWKEAEERAIIFLECTLSFKVDFHMLFDWFMISLQKAVLKEFELKRNGFSVSTFKIIWEKFIKKVHHDLGTNEF